jgi:ligand-binding SRPBCC domain-containing protein
MSSSVGPFQRWWHEHTFTAIDGGMKTVMVDVVEFRSRFGPLGDITDRLLLDRYMPRLLRRRNAWLKAALETPR